MPNHTYTPGQKVTITATVEALDTTGAPYGGRDLVPFDSIGVVRPAGTGTDDRVAELEAQVARVEALADMLGRFAETSISVTDREVYAIARDGIREALAGEPDE